MSEHDETVYRTSPGRVGKLMAILVGLVVVGGVIFFSLGDYWISELSPAGKAFAGITDEPAAPAVAQTGADIPITLDFIESKDLEHWLLMHYPANWETTRQLMPKLATE